MDERKLYSLVVTIICFALMAILIIGVAIYTWITGGFDNPNVSANTETAIVETADQ